MPVNNYYNGPQYSDQMNAFPAYTNDSAPLVPPERAPGVITRYEFKTNWLIRIFLFFILLGIIIALAINYYFTISAFTGGEPNVERPLFVSRKFEDVKTTGNAPYLVSMVNGKVARGFGKEIFSGSFSSDKGKGDLLLANCTYLKNTFLSAMMTTSDNRVILKAWEVVDNSVKSRRTEYTPNQIQIEYVYSIVPLGDTGQKAENFVLIVKEVNKNELSALTGKYNANNFEFSTTTFKILDLDNYYPKTLNVSAVALSSNSIALTLYDGRITDCKIKVCMLGLEPPVCISAPSNGDCKHVTITKLSSWLFVTLETKEVKIYEFEVRSLKINLRKTIQAIQYRPILSTITAHKITESNAVLGIAYMDGYNLRMLALNLSLSQYTHKKNADVVIDTLVDPEFKPILTSSEYTMFVTYKKDNSFYTKHIQILKEGADIDNKPITVFNATSISVASDGYNILHLSYNNAGTTRYDLVRSHGGLKPFGIVMNTKSKDKIRDVYFSGVVNHKEDWNVGTTLYGYPDGKIDNVFSENAVKVGITISPNELLISLH